MYCKVQEILIYVINAPAHWFPVRASLYLAKTSGIALEHPIILVRTRVCRFIPLFVDKTPLGVKELANAEILKENIFKQFKTGHDRSSKIKLRSV